MPAEDGLRLDENQGRPPAPPAASQQHPEHPVRPAKARPSDASLQGPELVPLGNILEDKFLMAAAGERDREHHRDDECKHVLIVVGVVSEIKADGILANHRPTCAP